MDKIQGEKRSFSIELASKQFLEKIMLSNEGPENALIEGTIGNLVSASFTEGYILEIVGENGTIRVNINDWEITRPKVKEAENQ